MESLYFLIPLSVVVIIVAVAVFFWAVNNGQYDDLDAEGEKILFDDEDDFVAPVDSDFDGAASDKEEDNEKDEEEDIQDGH